MKKEALKPMATKRKAGYRNTMDETEYRFKKLKLAEGNSQEGDGKERGEEGKGSSEDQMETTE